MKRVLFVPTLLTALSISATAQVNSSTGAVASSTGSTNAGPLSAATAVSGKLQSDLNVKKAGVGDKVFLKTTNDVKQNGKVVIKKGSTIAGHVTQVTKNAKGNAGSSIGVMFSELVQGGRSIPIDATIMSIVSASSASQAALNNDIFAASSSSASSSTRSNSGAGGLLGGVTNTVGGTLNSTVNTVGDVTSTGVGNVGSASNTVSGSLRGLTISNSSGGSVSGGTTLTMPGKDLRIDQGSTVNLSVSNSTSVSKSQ